jgi:aspartate aminotransferase-like enzyme
MINHRGPEFVATIRDVTARLQRWFQTSNDVLTLTASGTGALEAAVVNTLSPGDRVLAVTTGAFGDRFAEIASTYGAQVDRLSVAWGQAAQPAELAAALAGGPYKAVLLTHNETSTGVTNPLAELAAVVRHTDALVLVDAISSLSSIDLKTDAWGCDVVLSGSQKGWMVPPGLALVSVSPRAWEAYRSARMPRFYFDLGQAKKYLERGETPATPAVSLYFAFQAALDLLDREGMANVFARHQRCADRVRQGVRALGLELFADPAYASNTVTAVKPPPDVDVARLLKLLREAGVILSGGQGKLAGQIFRIGHLGMIQESDVDEILAALGKALPQARLTSVRSG